MPEHTASFLVNADEVTVDRDGERVVASVAGRRFVWVGISSERAAELAWQAAHPKPSPERVEAQRLADERGEDVCGRCGGLGGWRGWPGFTCHECDGRRTVAA